MKWYLSRFVSMPPHTFIKARYDGRMPRGDCYEVHVRSPRDEVDALEKDDWLVRHGAVTDAAGKAIEHCRLEHHGYAYDFPNSNQFEFPVDEFRRITKARDITSYTSEEVSLM